VTGSRRRGDCTLVINQRGECLGFGRIHCNLNGGDDEDIVVKNISDVGDFLRRERRHA
jgi:ribosome biogenesis protein Nip4